MFRVVTTGPECQRVSEGMDTILTVSSTRNRIKGLCSVRNTADPAGPETVLTHGLLLTEHQKINHRIS